MAKKNPKAEFREYLAGLLSDKGEVYVEEQVKLIMRMAKKAFESTDDEIVIPEEDINAVYLSYPTKCVVTARNLGKSASDKERIGRLLKDKTKDELILTIGRYVEDCKRDKVYMKNFGTFLNNLPEFDLTERPKTVDIGGYRDLRKITEAQ